MATNTLEISVGDLVQALDFWDYYKFGNGDVGLFLGKDDKYVTIFVNGRIITIVSSTLLDVYDDSPDDIKIISHL